MELRDYQKKALKYYLNRKTSSLLVLATGKGKSILSLEIIKDHLVNNKGNILILCPTQIIRQQLFNLYKRSINATILDNPQTRKDRKDETRVFLCCYPTYQILSREQPSFVLSVSLIIIDEVHKLTKNTKVGMLLRSLSESSKVIKIGLTATPGPKKNTNSILSVLCSEGFSNKSFILSDLFNSIPSNTFIFYYYNIYEFFYF